MPTLKIQPPHQTYALVSFPTPNILLVTLNRPKALNCINQQGHYELHQLWEWFDEEPSLRAGIITGTGRAFCAGADLKEWDQRNSSKDAPTKVMQSGGFGGLSRRQGKKPVIAAVNGLAYGGGFELIINCDLIIASSSASFALPEVKRGVAALAGALPRLARTVGRQRAMEMAMTGRTLSAEEGKTWGFVNEIVRDGEAVNKAMEYAEMISDNSPDSVIVSREGIKMGWESVGAEEGSRLMNELWGKRLNEGANLQEGVRAFVEKRKPRWVPSKL